MTTTDHRACLAPLADFIGAGAGTIVAIANCVMDAFSWLL
jgi:hypothetical protein